MNIAVSACLLGVNCRFDGESRPSDAVRALREHHHVVALCPESMAQLPRPRLPNEVVEDAQGTRVMNAEGIDNTNAFEEGARLALERAQKGGCALAVLKSKSPSCGSGRIFDGTFTGTLTDGWGITARLFRDAGIRVIDEKRLEQISAQCGGCPSDEDLARA